MTDNKIRILETINMRNDAMVKVSDQEKIIIEINGSRNPNIFKKNSEYAF